MPEFAELLKGYRRFRSTDYAVERQRWEELATGQTPPIMIVACCDSRVDPDNRALLRVSLPLLPPGRYKVAWRVLSVDSHVTEGDFTFRIAP